MAEDSGLERTEPASSRRIEKAREEGDVPRSRELGTCLLLLAAGVGLWLIGGDLVNQISLMLTNSMQFDRSMAFDLPRLFDLQMAHFIQMLIALAPFAGILIVVALISPALIGGWLFSLQALTPNFERMNPLSGLGRMISMRSLVELVKALSKATVVGFVAFQVMRHHYESIIGLASESSKEGLTHVASLIVMCFISISSGLIIIMAIDVPFQLRSYANKLKMTRQEVIQESKEANGNPQIKAKIRSQQREMARRRMMSKVPTADVVVTNPNHYAVALKYIEGRMSAPIVIAKGADLVAARIRELAEEHHIPLLEAPPLARALYAHAELNSQIPESLYTAVAEVLAYVFQLRAYKENGGMAPTLPEVIEVPEELDPTSPAALNLKKSKMNSVTANAGGLNG
ncbi:flagellar biosynthesis protein FlhB [Solimicrobium silvestre]|uniref:Flagellar biosynthetic protein FlhB n=1 Tax=Solimicrobium silvestre TaxID=2099400 RepID=A0A2S9GVW1_9BURK|nr:flagellar biosynthesis protein FlhB [Solimicrobium silvestre]PRC91854.1 flhB: flagellar biosynthetic protein FlhB [Solimicrobium silvestre]